MAYGSYILNVLNICNTIKAKSHRAINSDREVNHVALPNA